IAAPGIPNAAVMPSSSRIRTTISAVFMVYSPTDNVSGGIDLRQDIPGLRGATLGGQHKNEFHHVKHLPPTAPWAPGHRRGLGSGCIHPHYPHLNGPQPH